MIATKVLKGSGLKVFQVSQAEVRPKRPPGVGQADSSCYSFWPFHDKMFGGVKLWLKDQEIPFRNASGTASTLHSQFISGPFRLSHTNNSEITGFRHSGGSRKPTVSRRLHRSKRRLNPAPAPDPGSSHPDVSRGQSRRIALV